MPLDRRAVESALLSKGFRSREGRHRRFVYFTRDGQKTPVWTMLSHGSRRELSDGLARAMARQCKLTRREFDDLVACPLTRDQYEAKLLAADAI